MLRLCEVTETWSSMLIGWVVCFNWTQGFPAEYCIVTRWSMLFTSHVSDFNFVAGRCKSFQHPHHVVSVRSSQIVEHAMSGTANDLATDPQWELLHLVGHAKWSIDRERASETGNVRISASHSKSNIYKPWYCVLVSSGALQALKHNFEWSLSWFCYLRWHSIDLNTFPGDLVIPNITTSPICQP